MEAFPKQKKDKLENKKRPAIDGIDKFYYLCNQRKRREVFI